MSRKYITVGLLAGLTAGTGAGLILQQTGSAGASPAVVEIQQQDDETDTTETEADERPTRGEYLDEVLAPLVADGTLTQAQADAVVEAFAAARPEGGRGPGHHGDHGPRGHRGPKLDVVAEVLGVTVEELRTQLQAGSTIAEIAGDRTQAVIDALVADATARIEEAVGDGRLPREEADEKLAGLVERITEKVNSARPTAPEQAPADDTEG